MNKHAFPMMSMSQLVDKVVNPVAVDAATMYEQIGIRSHGKGIFYKEPVTGQSLGDKRVFWVEPDCLVINIVFAWEQAVARTRASDKGKIASHRFPMYRPKAALADLDYLTYLFRTELGKHLLTLASPGGAGRNKTLGQAEFMRIQLPCPPVPEQRRIVEILITWDQAIQKTEKLLENSKTQKCFLAQQLLTGQRRIPGHKSEWRVHKLRRLLEIVYGTSPKGIADENGRYPIVGTGGIIAYTNETTSDQPAIVIGRKGSIDKPQLIRTPFWATDTTYFCQLKSECDLQWLYQRLSLVPWRNYNEASGVPSLSRPTLYSISLAVPPIKEQKAIAEILTSADDGIQRLEQDLRLLRAEKSALMQQLLTGKRRVTLNEEVAA